jgi:aromatic-L-amino-acid/L-tryptophan decarboxylase
LTQRTAAQRPAVPEHAWVFDGVARADSVVVNPHKWLFTPFDLSDFYCRRFEALRGAFALTPEYLRTDERRHVRNLMDTGISLGRRFRALKLWMLLRYFGADGMRSRIARHIQLAKTFAAWVDADPDFERVAPVPLSVVCFRAAPRQLTLGTSALDELNAEVLARITPAAASFCPIRYSTDVTPCAWPSGISGRPTST